MDCFVMLSILAQIRNLTLNEQIYLQRVARGLLGILVKTGSLPLILHQMALLTDPVHMRQGQGVLTVVVDAMKMAMQTLAADAHLTGCHQHHQVGGDTKYVD